MMIITFLEMNYVKVFWGKNQLSFLIMKIFFIQSKYLNKNLKKIVYKIFIYSVDEFMCHVPGCVKVFETLVSFEDHYNTAHRYVCETCHKRLPSPHLLDLHISETHDSYFAALAERKPMVFLFYK